MSADGRGKLSPLGVAREIASVYRHHWRFLVPAAVVILIPQSIADGLSESYDIQEIEDFLDVETVAVVLLISAVSLMGQAVYAGLTAVAVVDWRAGQPLPPLLALLRSLPLGRLFLLDIVITFGAAIGFMLLFFPGLIFLTYVAASAPLMKLEHLGVSESIGRSISLVRGRARWVFVIVAGAVVITELGVEAVTLPFDGAVMLSMMNIVGQAVFQPFEGLAVALVAVHLLDLHGQAPAPEVMARALVRNAE
jgi:hypothetical protein